MRWFLNLHKTHQAIWALIIANFLWGAAPPLFKWSLESIEPFTLGFLRFAIGALIILPFVYKNLHVDRRDFGKIFLLAFFGITINISFFFLALKNTDSINAPIIGSSAPIFIILSSMVFLKEQVKKQTIIGALIGLLGVLVIVVTPALTRGFDTSVVGNLFLIVATIGGIIHLLLAKELSQKYEPLTIVFYMFVIGAFTFIPSMFSEINTVGFFSQLTGRGIFGVIYGAIAASVIANFCYFWAIKYLPASEVGLFTYMDPIIAILIAVPLLGETPSPEYVIGTLLVFGGIYIAEGRIHYHPFHRLRTLQN